MSDSLIPPVQNLYTCALTNDTEVGIEVPDAVAKADGLQDLPPGWTAVVIKRRVINPRYALIQEVKNAFVQGTIGQFPPSMPADVKEAQSLAVKVQFDAQFSHLLSSVPQYLTDHEVAYIGPVEDNEDLRDAYNDLRANLNLPLISATGEIQVEDTGLAGSQNTSESKAQNASSADQDQA